MNLRSIAIVASLGLAGALLAAGPAEAGHRDRDHGHRHYRSDYRSGRSYRGNSRSHRSYRPYIAPRPYRYRLYVRPYEYAVPYGYGYGYVPYVRNRRYCGPRLRIGVGW
jgi:hypothetical protein